MNINNNKLNLIRYSIYKPIYDLIATRFNKQRKRSIDLLSPKSGEKVLILGAGTGLDLDYLPNDIDITAIDLTPAMVEQMKKRAKVLGIQGEFLVMDGQKLDLPDEEFDCIILHLIIAVIPDPYKCIAEVERVLKPGGRLTVFDKFIADNKKPSLIRSGLNVITNILFTDINRRLGDIINTTNLKVESEEAAGFSGNFKIVLAKKTPH